MPTGRHEELRAAITRARAALAEYPDAETAAAPAALIAAAEPFANFSQAVAPPPRRVDALAPDTASNTVRPLTRRKTEP
ncbi:hypothetical protein [Embleya sp. NPDC059237]|uniref:hypothetical protein n=1 Tax=Embleya sp. NPDC059237 TaxID=3346784 RepID=UPI003675A0C5